jgi:hypothetical protein
MGAGLLVCLHEAADGNSIAFDLGIDAPAPIHA